MSAPTTRRACGRFRRGSRISSPRNEAASIPPNANAIVEKKRASLRPAEGMRCAAEKDVAEPNRANTTAPQTTRRIAGIQVATAAALCSHVPYFRPLAFTAVAMAIPPSEKARKKRGAAEKEGEEERAILLKRGALCAPEEERVRGREVEESREERQVARPVEESRDEAREVSKGPARPHVEPTLLRMARGELQDRRHERHEEPESREDPDHERGRPGFGGRRDPPEAEARQRVEEDEVPEAEDPPELHQRSGTRGGSIAAAFSAVRTAGSVYSGAGSVVALASRSSTEESIGADSKVPSRTPQRL